MKQEEQIVRQPARLSVHDLYDRYAGMLLGYLLAVVKDRKVAEHHLVNVFKQLPLHLDEINSTGVNAWVYLQRLTRKQIAQGSALIGDGSLDGIGTGNQLLSQLDERQRQVFLSSYYHGMSIPDIAAKLGIEQEVARKLLKQVFDILRKSA